MIYGVLLLTISIVLLLYIVYDLAKPYIAEKSIMMLIKNFNKSNFVVVDNDCSDRKCSDRPEDQDYIAGNKNTIIYRCVKNPEQPVPGLIIRDKKRFFEAVYSKLECGLGESYVAGDWDSDNLMQLMVNLSLNLANINNISYFDPATATATEHSKNQIESDKQNILHHYDVGNDFYKLFLTDPLMAYSCGIWEPTTKTLDQAQFNKVNIIIKKLNAKKGSRILDIGCGWGKIAEYVAARTNGHVTGITISDKQAEIKSTKNVTIELLDYRNLCRQYDCIYSIGMFEHVRAENYDLFFQTIKRCLVPGGRFVLHTIIGYNYCQADKESTMESFVLRHIFPGGQIPAPEWIVWAIQRAGLKIIHAEFWGGQHYARTLKEWRDRLLASKDYVVHNFDIKLLRTYDYYMASCYAQFTTGSLGIGHFVVTNEELVSTKNSFVYPGNCGLKNTQ
jgi:cyclopropane-fatty-acyl-phospholipid synthase